MLQIQRVDATGPNDRSMDLAKRTHPKPDMALDQANQGDGAPTEALTLKPGLQLLKLSGIGIRQGHRPRSSMTGPAAQKLLTSPAATVQLTTAWQQVTAGDQDRQGLQNHGRRCGISL